LGVLREIEGARACKFCNPFILQLFLIKVGVSQNVRLEIKGIRWLKGKASTEALDSLEGYFLYSLVDINPRKV
jgi:hypothetical protein